MLMELTRLLGCYFDSASGYLVSSSSVSCLVRHTMRRTHHSTVNTNLTTFYRPTFTYAAQSGVGSFDSAYATSYLSQLVSYSLNTMQSVVPYTTLSLAHNIVVNPQHSISVNHAGCANETCDSYIIPGGIELSHPNPPTNYTDDPVLLFGSVPALQIDFHHGIGEGDFLSDEDCELYFERPYTIAIRFCLGRSQSAEGSILSSRSFPYNWHPD